ncbi:helix-turn-helix transcriptional regulator [Paraburkholderia sp. BL23I1N1]|uniref:helix-turn-helix domain-containing protein n=1 Tax=Paraburkholderia sp. BL23I1N1 TaxID=1938802 RepID=UPI00217D5E44
MSGVLNMRKTPWFPSSIKPVREGLYETHWLIRSWSILRYWDGKLWRTDGQVCSRQDYAWRGLARLGQLHVAGHAAEHGAERRPIPHEVVNATVDGATPSRAWREHLGLTQAEIAAHMGISQSAYSQQEGKKRLRESSRTKIAAALGITADQLDF